VAARDTECYRFGPFVLNVEERELRRGDAAVLITGKVFDLLLLLLRGSYVGVARRQALAGNTVAARKAYESFFELWKDADPDVPILIQARQEYAAMTR
jgi:hypothetical protein